MSLSEIIRKTPLEASRVYTHVSNAVTKIELVNADITQELELTSHELMLLADIQQCPYNPVIRTKGPKTDDFDTKIALENLSDMGLLDRKNGNYIASRRALNGNYVLSSKSEKQENIHASPYNA